MENRLNVLHAADLHTRDKDIDECRKVQNSMCDYATDHKEEIDLIILAGDLTDSKDVKLDSMTSRLLFGTVKTLADVAPVVIVTGTPSHEGMIPELLPNISAKHQIYTSIRPEQLLLDESGVIAPVDDPEHTCPNPVAILSMVPTPTKQFFEIADSDLFGSIEETDQGIAEALTGMFTKFGMLKNYVPGYHIIVGHFQVGGAYVSDTQQLTGVDIEISKDQIMSARPDLVCLGHIHKAQQMGKSPIFYPGSLYRKDFGEMDTKGFYVHTLDSPVNRQSGIVEFKDAPALQSKFIEVPTRKLLRIDYDFTKDTDFDTFDLEPILYTYSLDEIEGAILRVEFKIWQDMVSLLGTKEQIETFYEPCGLTSLDVRIIPVPRQNARAVVVLESERLRDKVKARAEMADETVDVNILEKADVLEDLPSETVLKWVA